jgi:hypothetical protein
VVLVEEEVEVEKMVGLGEEGRDVVKEGIAKVVWDVMVVIGCLEEGNVG